MEVEEVEAAENDQLLCPLHQVQPSFTCQLIRLPASRETPPIMAAWAESAGGGWSLHLLGELLGV